MDKNFIEFSNFLLSHNFPTGLVEKFKTYQSILNKKNQKLNLVSKNSLERIWSAHFLDSILICEEIDFSDKTVLDFGTGAGFPGTPLKILYPTMKIFLLESVRKKVLFLRYLLEKLDLQNSEVLNIRLENLGNQFINFFDIVLVRAVRMKNIYYKKCFELLRKNGEIIIYQSKNCHSRVNGFKKMYSNKYVRVITKYHPIKGIKHYIVIRND